MQAKTFLLVILGREKIFGVPIYVQDGREVNIVS